MKMELEGTVEEVTAIMAVFARGLGNTTARAESVVLVRTMGTVGADVVVEKEPVKEPLTPVQQPPTEPGNGKVETGNPGDAGVDPMGVAAEKLKKSRAARNANKPVETAEQPKADKPAETNDKPSETADTHAEQPAEQPKPDKPVETAEQPKADKPVDKPTIGDDSWLPEGWATWSVAKRRLWAQTFPDLSPSQRFALLQQNPAVQPTEPEAAKDKPVETAKTEEVKTEPPKTEPPKTEPPKDTAGDAPVVLPDWGKWSLAKRIVWVTSLSAADTDKIVDLLEFRKEIGEVNEANLPVARRKLQIAMRMRDQVENGKKGK